MHKHALSQINDAEAERMTIAALNDPACRDSRVVVKPAIAIGKHDMLQRTVLDTPEGPLHQVAVVRVIDGEPMGFDTCYLDEADAIAVFDHLAEVAAETGMRTPPPT